MSGDAGSPRPAGAGYVGRFAPSPTGALHAGSMVAALASWLDARAHGGRWLVRIEDVDRPRCVAGAAERILRQLHDCGLRSDDPVTTQHERFALYQDALDDLAEQGLAYPCCCTRREIEAWWLARGQAPRRHEERVYPGTCRPERGGPSRPDARAWRLDTAPHGHGIVIGWHDRRLGPQSQDVAHAVGDFVLRRADGLWAYQLAVVVDDAAQGITDVVRGEDLADNTARQIALQRALSLPTPRYLHTPLVRAADGQKLSKQNGAAALDTRDPLPVLRAAAAVLGLPAMGATQRDDWLAAAVRAWAAAWGPGVRARGADPSI
jgi:glutamyl-Q tRNA(Asp) synthetase